MINRLITDPQHKFIYYFFFKFHFLREEYQLDVGNGHLIFGVDWEKTINDRKIKFRT